MNDYDKAGRYLIKRDAAGFFRWLFDVKDLAFSAWIDARRLALPDQGDLTSDLVGAFHVAESFEAVCVELQAVSHEDAARRLLLGYIPRLAGEPSDPAGLPVTAVGGAVVNLTGPTQAATVSLVPTVAPDCRWEGRILQRTLRDEDAAGLLGVVITDIASRWLLAWLPLMRGGGEPAIIQSWRAEALRLTDARDRATLGGLTLVFARLAGRLATWQRGLEGWNVETSPFLDEFRAEGRAEGSRETLRKTILGLGRQRFRRAPTRKLRAELDALTDLGRLERIAERLLAADSWADLFATP
jgi:hypothetical protein